MFIPKIPENAILRSYLYNTEATAFKNQYVSIVFNLQALLNKAQNWYCPKSKENRQTLPASNWQIERQALIAYGDSLVINTNAQLCSTFHNKAGISYLVWLEFTGPDAIIHKLDCVVDETIGDITKIVDGIECETVYDDIITKGSINPSVAKKLNSIGSITWQGSAEAKTQYKLNSFRQQKCFEKAAEQCSFIELRQLDCFDDYLYRGDPGCIADYDLTLILDDGTRLTTRVDLKLLMDLNTIQDQKAHDAELLIASALLTSDIQGHWVKPPRHNCQIGKIDKFKQFMTLFKEELNKEASQYIKIHRIDPNTGKVVYDFFK